MVDLWFAQTNGQSFRGFVSADAMWAALDPAARPWYGKPISTVPLREIFNASPAALNVGNVVGVAWAGLGAEIGRAVAPVAVLAGIGGLGLIGARMMLGGGTPLPPLVRRLA